MGINWIRKNYEISIGTMSYIGKAPKYLCYVEEHQ